MEQLLRKTTVQLTGCALDKQEECPISGEYVLPEYCPDVAVVLKCFADPRIQTRQWSGDQLLLDGTAVVRVLYLDEERRCVHSLEFSQAFSCVLRGEGKVDNAAVNVELSTKYLTCRALSPRRVEVRGAILVAASADCVEKKDFAIAVEDGGLCVHTETVPITIPVGTYSKLLTVSESLEFEETMPPAEMLLGGECRAFIRECKLLTGKAIVKGQVAVHQLYTDTMDGEHTHCLDFVLPFSQIVDVSAAQEGMLYKASVCVVSDTERCSVGPSGDQTVLDVNVKLLVQVQVYNEKEIVLLKDAFHSRYPVTAKTEEVELCSLLGMRWESIALPMKIALPAGRSSEILDVTVCPQEQLTECCDGHFITKGRMAICVLARDTDGEVVYDEFLEDFGLEHPCQGNQVQMALNVMEVRFRAADDALELQVKLNAAITDYMCYRQPCVSELQLCKDSPYPNQKVTAWLYYADCGESVWDIGRVCHTSPSCIAEENALQDDCINERKLVLVPVIQ